MAHALVPSPKESQDEQIKDRDHAYRCFLHPLVHHEFVEPGTTVNSKFYVEVLKRLKRRVQRIRLDIADNWKLHHDNVRAHSAFIVTDYLVKAGLPTIPQPLYSPDLAPPDFFLFPRLKTPLKVEAFWDSGRDQSSLHRSIKGHSGGGLPQRIQELEVSLEPMYRRKRRLF